MNYAQPAQVASLERAVRTRAHRYIASCTFQRAHLHLFLLPITTSSGTVTSDMYTI